MSSRRGNRGQLKKLTPQHKQERLARRKRKKTWAARVWMKRHVQGGK